MTHEPPTFTAEATIADLRARIVELERNAEDTAEEFTLLYARAEAAEKALVEAREKFEELKTERSRLESRLDDAREERILAVNEAHELRARLKDSGALLAEAREELKTEHARIRTSENETKIALDALTAARAQLTELQAANVRLKGGTCAANGCDEIHADALRQITGLQFDNVALRAAIKAAQSWIVRRPGWRESQIAKTLAEALSSPNPGAPLLAVLREAIKNVRHDWDCIVDEPAAGGQPRPDDKCTCGAVAALAKLRALTGGGE